MKFRWDKVVSFNEVIEVLKKIDCKYNKLSIGNVNIYFSFTYDDIVYNMVDLELLQQFELVSEKKTYEECCQLYGILMPYYMIKDLSDMESFLYTWNDESIKALQYYIINEIGIFDNDIAYQLNEYLQNYDRNSLQTICYKLFDRKQINYYKSVKKKILDD